MSRVISYNGANYVVNDDGTISPYNQPQTQPQKPSLSSVIEGQGQSMATNYAGQQAGKYISSSLGNGASAGAGNVATPVATASDGSGVLMSDGSTAAMSSSGADAASSSGAATGGGVSLGSVLSGALAAKGGYDAIRGFNNGGKGIQQGTTEVGAGLGSILGGPVGGVVGAAAGNVAGYGLKGTGWKNDLALGGMGMLGAGIVAARHLGFNLIHQSTKEAEAENWGGLAKNGVAGADAAYLANHPEGDTGKWTTGKYAGQDWSFDKASDLAKDDPSQFRSVYGNLDTFGNDWSKYSPGQQDAITKNVLNAGLYDGQKGDIVITDKDKAKQIAADTIANYKDPTPAATTQSTGNTRPQTRAPSLADVPLISSLAFQPITVPDYSKAVNPTIKNKYL